MKTFSASLGLGKTQSPFPWQEELLKKLRVGIGQHTMLDVPTGLGKTSAMAAWLVAVAEGATLPRRLVYIVDRRAVVDQATIEAERLRTWVNGNPQVKSSLGLAGEEQLAISTLRGQFADNKEWLSDPSKPAIIVGTVDMVGSRLLFEGYGVSRKMRPYHAGFLGADSLFVLDEAHLVPPFEELLKSVVTSSVAVGEQESLFIPRPKLLSLSATGRTDDGDVIQVGKADLKHRVAAQRLNAVKRLRFIDADEDDDRKLPERLADEAWALSQRGSLPVRIIVFCNSRADASAAMASLIKHAKGDTKQDIPKREIDTQLFVGARRVRERQEVADWLATHGFLGGGSTPERPTFVCATSAGEVGVDMDADHMAGDLVALERMIQRFGRVNRRGERESEIRIVTETPDSKLQKVLAKEPEKRNSGEQVLAERHERKVQCKLAIEMLPAANDAVLASPEEFRQLKIKSQTDHKLRSILKKATTPPPLRPELTRPVLDSWSMTSLEEHSGRPIVAPWLRGWIDDEPQTTVVWRHHLPTRSVDCGQQDVTDYFEAASIHLTEKLEATTNDVHGWVMKRAEKIAKARTDSKLRKSIEPSEFPTDDETVAIILDNSGKFQRKLTLNELCFRGEKKQASKDKETFRRELQNKTIVIDRRLGGLADGLLEASTKESEFAPSADYEREDWMPSSDKPAEDGSIPPFRILSTKADSNSEEQPDSWKNLLSFPIRLADEDEPSEYLLIQKFRLVVTSEASRSTLGHRQLQPHLDDTVEEVDRITAALPLPDDLKLVFRIAARTHDLGKDCDRWQNAFSAKPDGRPYAKTKGPFRSAVLDRYRHEFGSLPKVCDDADFKKLTPELQQLTLHLVAAHHGFARPVIRPNGCDDAPPSELVDRARDVALRFASLQRRFGPWALAWLESILRAADHRASARIDNPADSEETNNG